MADNFLRSFFQLGVTAGDHIVQQASHERQHFVCRPAFIASRLGRY